MATSKKSATNKTAHVMNLLSRHTPPAENNTDTVPTVPGEIQVEGGEQVTEPSRQTPILVSLSEDASIAETLKNALEAELEAETAAAQPTTTEPPAESVQSETEPPVESVSEPETEPPAESVQPETESPTESVQSESDPEPSLDLGALEMSVLDELEPHDSDPDAPTMTASEALSATNLESTIGSDDSMETTQEPEVMPEAPVLDDTETPVEPAPEVAETPVEPAPEAVAEAAESPTEPAPEAAETPTEPAPETVTEETEPVTESPAEASEEQDSPANTLEGDRVNIMEMLVKANSDRYISIMEVCTCPRCKIDIETIALNNLPPKYVYMKPSEISARSNVYAGRFQTAVTAQLMRACQTVLDNPRHDE
jgi:hypothetical protein